MGRCAAGLATLPVVARHFPDAAVVWFDAHGDSNVPEHSTTGYLGGMVLSGASGLWDSGLGSGLRLENIVLVGSRDLDAYEQALIDEGKLTHVAAGMGLSEALRDAVGGRRVYIHLDCDVMEPRLVPTEYSIPGGLSFADLGAACEVLAENTVLGLEVAELQSRWPSGEPADARQLFDAIAPLIGQR